MKPSRLARGLLIAALTVANTAVAQTYTRTDTVLYEDNLSLWVLGQVKTSINDDTGLVESQTDYDPATALPIRSYAFGKLQQAMTYRTNGTMETLSDGRGGATTVTLSDWKRGIPQLITYADGKAKSAVVNDLGLIASVTDETGSQSCYQYDAMGRLARITYPSERATSRACEEYDAVYNPSGWNPTILSFAPVTTNPKFGIPTGHWKQTVSTGDGVKNTYYDAFWRPLVVESYDARDQTDTTSISVTRYDADGRPEYQSFALSSLSNYATITQGTRTGYDALGRITSVKQDSELGVLNTTTHYDDLEFKTVVTNPRAKTTTTYYKAYDQPTTDWPTLIEHPEGVRTDIVRDVFGKPRSITRRNAAGTVGATRSYVYYTTQELCKTVEPETTSTVTSYDAAGNLSWSASGLNLPATTNCDVQYVPTTARVNRTYDQRNRLSTLTFPDGVGNQVWQYTDDGLPSQVTTYNGTNQTLAVINAYSYNHRRLLGGQGESISQTNWYTMGFGYG